MRVVRKWQVYPASGGALIKSGGGVSEIRFQPTTITRDAYRGGGLSPAIECESCVGRGFVFQLKIELCRYRVGLVFSLPLELQDNALGPFGDNSTAQTS